MCVCVCLLGQMKKQMKFQYWQVVPTALIESWIEGNAAATGIRATLNSGDHPPLQLSLSLDSTSDIQFPLSDERKCYFKFGNERPETGGRVAIQGADRSGVSVPGLQSGRWEMLLRRWLTWQWPNDHSAAVEPVTASHPCSSKYLKKGLFADLFLAVSWLPAAEVI